MSKVIEDVTARSASVTLTESGSARWLAPELIEGLIATPTKAADTYSFAMAILELITGKHPFSNRKRDASVIHDVVVKKSIPPRPDGLSDALWSLMEECWRRNSDERPTMAQVAMRLNVEASEAEASNVMNTS